MQDSVFSKMHSYASQDCELQASSEYLAQNLQPILQKGETVLICFPRSRKTSLGTLLGTAVTSLGSKAVFWEEDLRWLALLRLAFLSRATTIIGPPLIILGLSKLAAARNTPLNIFNAVMAGYPCMDWMMDGIEKGLDCKVWGIFGPGSDAIVSGFSCSHGRGIHIRQEKYHFDIVDRDNQCLPAGTQGIIRLSDNCTPENQFCINAFGKLLSGGCSCGNPAPKLVDIEIQDTVDLPLFKLAEDLLYWRSVLECRVEKSEFGLELEIVVFPGLKLPKLPTCAKLIVRSWNPEKDTPISLEYHWDQVDFYQEEY